MVIPLLWLYGLILQIVKKNLNDGFCAFLCLFYFDSCTWESDDKEGLKVRKGKVGRVKSCLVIGEIESNTI